MPPLVTSLKNIKLAYKRPDGTIVFKAQIDPEWVIVSVPHGGYLLAIALTAAILHQQAIPNAPTDPAHISAQFLKASSVGEVDIEVKAIRKGKEWWNLVVEMKQGGITRIMGHVLFTNMAEDGATPVDGEFVIPASSPYSPICPFLTPPSQCPNTLAYPIFRFGHLMSWSDDLAIEKRREEESRLDLGTWHRFTSPEDSVYAAPGLLCYLGDMFKKPPEMLYSNGPKSDNWFPTLVMSVYFVSKISPTQDRFDPYTAGLYSYGKFVNSPNGRHDSTAEIWTAPKKGQEGESWRENQRCLAVASQMALLVSMEKNARRGENLKL